MSSASPRNRVRAIAVQQRSMRAVNSLLAVAAADLDAVAERLDRLAASQGVVVPAHRATPESGWTGDGFRLSEPTWA